MMTARLTIVAMFLRAKFGRFLAVIALLALATGPVAADGGLSAHDRNVYQRAFDAIAKDRWKEARREIERAKDPLLGKVVVWLDLTRPGPGRSFDEMTAFLNQNPDWPLRERLTAQAERAMPDIYPTDKVLAWYAERDPLTAPGAIKLLGALRASGQDERARRVAASSWINLDFGKEQEADFIARFKDLLSPADHLARLDRLLWDGNPEQATRMLTRVGEGHARLAKARMQLRDKKITAASARGSVPPELRKDPGLVYEMARRLRLDGKVENAVALLDPPPTGSRRPDLMWAELYRAARELLTRGDISAAYRLAAAHGTETGEAFVEGEFFAGWIALRYLNEPDMAAPHFLSLYTGAKSVISKARGAYWSGRTAEAKGDTAAAADWYRNAARHVTVFYGQLAASRLPDPIHLQMDSGLRASPAEQAAFNKLELVRAVRQLGDIGENQRVRPFIVNLTNRAGKPSDYVLLAGLARSVKREDLAIHVAKEARQSGVELTEFLFPTLRVPQDGAPEAALTLAIIKQESAFDQRAESSAGALGLMQLMPSTAKPLAKSVGIKKLDPKKLLSDAGLNMRLGRLYLDQLIERFGGSYIMAIAAYNAGPSRVRQWSDLYGDPRQAEIDAIDWIENIPFNETRNYVMRVMENLQIYRSILAKEGIRIALDDDLNRHAVN
ncbi:lytic transglycosylase domain-containing protein [Dongia mobilis]|nr:lytic transglycosylase domain-containing protein [Dongia mobilis]